MAEINLRDAAARRVGFDQLRPQDSTKTLFTDGASPGKGDVGNLKNQPLAPKDTSDASIAISSPSKEYNNYNHLNHMEMTCGYDVKYFITPTALTHAASIFRHIAFGDISSIISEAKKYIEEQKNIADKEFKAAAANVIKNQVAQPKGELLNVEAKKKSEYKYLDQLNIPWTLRVPKSGALEIINNDNGKDIIALDSELASADLVEDKSFPLSIEVDTGRDMYSCPQKPMPKGGFFLGKLTRPLFIPVRAGISYGGIFGKWFSEAKQVIVSSGVALSDKLKTSSAVAANRMIIPTKIDESGDSALVSLPLLSDFANIINVPVLYDEKDSKDYVKYIDTNKDISKEDGTQGIEIDSAWKQAISNGDLFYDQTGISYSKESLSTKTIIKHGTKNLTVQDLEKAISEVRDKVTSPILGRVAIPGAAKTGQSTPTIDNNSIKTFDQFSNLKVKEYIKEKDWQDIISLKLSNKTRWIGGIKSGSGAKTYSDIPSFIFWTPVISYLGKESDGSVVYGHSEPSTDTQFNQVQILYSESPPYAELKFGAERKAWDSPVVYSFSNSEILEDNIAPYLDPNILRYGLGSYIGDKYHVPVSSILEACSSLSGSLIENGFFSGTNFAVTHLMGNTKVDIYKIILSKISNSLFTSTLVGTFSDLEDKLTDSAFNKLWTKSSSSSSLNVSFSDLAMIATENETLVGEDRIYTIDNKGSISKNSPRFNSKVILGSLKDAKLHFGKEVNIQALEPVKSGSNIKISDILINSKVKKTSLFNPEDNSFVVDIQPGENIFYSEDKLKYITDPYVPNSAIPEEALFDKELSNRPGIVDIVSSFISPVSDKTLDQNKQPNVQSTGNKPVDQSAVKNLTLSNLAITKIVIGTSDETSSGKIDSNILKSLVYNETVTSNSSAENGYISSSLIGDFIFSLVSYEHFYSELISDYEKSKVALMGLAFTNTDKPGSKVKVTKKDNTIIIGRIVEESSDDIESFIITDDEGKEKTFLFSEVKQVKRLLTPSVLENSISTDIVKEYFKINSNTLSFNPLTTEEDEPDNLNYINSNVSFSPWDSFIKGETKIPEGENLLTTFEHINPSDNLELFVNNLNYGYNCINPLLNNLKLSTLKNEPTGAAKIFLSQSLRDVNQFETYTSLSANTSWINEYFINEYKLSSDFVNFIFADINSKIINEVKNCIIELSSETSLNGSLWGGKEIAKAKYLFPVDVISGEILNANEEFITSLVSKYSLLGNNNLLDINSFTAIGNILGLDYNNSQRDKEALTLGVFCLAGIILNDWIRSSGKLKSFIKKSVGPYYLYLKALEESDVNSIPSYTTNSIPDLAIFLNTVKESMLLGKVNDSGKQITDTFAVLKSKLLANWTIIDSSTSIFIPGTDTIKIPICLVESLDGLEDKYKFIDNTQSYSLETFSENILEGKWKVLYKVLTPGWLGNSSNADLALIRKSITHASFIVQLLDMIGFAMQTFIENSRVFDKLDVTNKEESDPAKRITTAISLRKDKIKNSAVYQRDSFGIGDLSTRDREFLVPLKDFTNMVKVSKEGESVKINRMYPMILKDLSADDLKNGISESTIVSPDVMDLSFINSPSDNRLMSMFLRPGYGYPEIVKNLGYRCIINNFQTFVKTQSDPKRFAFHGKWKKNQASLFSDRMLQQSVTDEIWDKVIKSTEWTDNIKKDPATSLQTSIFGMQVPSTYLSKFDNPNVAGINKTAIFDVEFGYLSSRPVFSQNINFTIPQFTGGIKFVAKAVNKKLQYRGNYPANLSSHLRTGYDKKANTQEVETAGAYINSVKLTKQLLSSEDEVLPENSFKTDLMILTGSALNPKGNTLKTTIADFYKSSDKSLGESLYILGLLGIPVSSSEEELESIDGDTDIDSLKTKIVSLINEDKLRDISFVKNAQVTITGKTFTDYVGNQHVYPFVPAGTGIDTFDGILNATFEQYNSMIQGGQDHDHIYDFHPLSFLTSATNIGLSKRRAVLFGSLTMAGILKDYTFIRDTNAINPYAGIYYKYPEISFDNDNREIITLSGRNGFKKGKKFETPNMLSVVVIPDFTESESSISQTINTYLGGVSSVDDNLSNNSVFEFFGVGSFLGAEYFEPGKEKQRQTKLLTNDNYGEDTSDYNSKNVILLKELFSRYYNVAKNIIEGIGNNIFLNFIAGCFFPGVLPGGLSIKDYINENKLESVVISTQLNKDEAAKISRSIASCFNLQTDYLPIYYDTVESIIYYSATAICHIKKRINTKGIKPALKESFEVLLDLLLYSNPEYLYLDGSTSSESDLDLVDRIDLYSLLSGYKDVQTIKRLSITEEGKGKDIESSFAISAQVYIGPSETGSDFESNPNAPFSVAVSQTQVDKLKIPSFAATRNFGENKTIFNIVSDTVGLGKILVRKTKGSEILETVTMDKDAIFLSAVNRILLSRSELKLRYLFDRFSGVSIKTYLSDSKTLQTLTLKEMSYVPSNYFVQKLGPILKNNYANQSKTISFSAVFGTDLNKLNCFKTIGPAKHMMLMGARSVPNASEFAKNFISKDTTYLGTRTGSVPLNGLISGDTNKIGLDLETFDKKTLATVWSLFSMKMFLATDNIGIKLEESEIKQEQIPIGETGRTKPAIVPIGKEALRLYADFDAYDFEESQNQSPNYVTRFKSVTVSSGNSLKLDWRKLNTGSIEQPGSPFAETILPTVKDQINISATLDQQIKVVAKSNGLQVTNFSTIGIQAT